MAFFHFFSGPPPEKIARKADALFETRQWGQAMLAYERALEKLEKQPQQSPELQKELDRKITLSRESLARDHLNTAEDLIRIGNYGEAREIITLALNLSKDPSLQQVLTERLRGIEAFEEEPEEMESIDDYYGLADVDFEEPFQDTSDDEYFFALCGTLPHATQEAYLGYGEDFKIGFIALNEGDFQTAAEYLSTAMLQHPEPDSYIPMELAAAYLHLGRPEEAEALLKTFLHHHPDTLQGYQLLCEIYWEQKRFDRVTALLASAPANQADSPSMTLLKGETYFQAGDFTAAREFYQSILKTEGWNETIAKALAKSCEAAGLPEDARALYKKIMDQCTGCRTRIDPEIKHRYAELSYLAGIRTSEVLELFLSLSREIPQHAALYYERVSHIYKAMGNTAEARRFKSFAKNAELNGGRQSGSG